MKRTYRVKVSFVQTDEEHQKVKDIFGVNGFKEVKVNRGENIIYNATIVTDNEVSSATINEIMKNNNYILSIERCDD